VSVLAGLGNGDAQDLAGLAFDHDEAFTRCSIVRSSCGEGNAEEGVET
jgi:hypothetical protein